MTCDASGSSIRDCPYQGLPFYTEEDSDFFFGRDRERDQLVARLRASRLTLFYGQSGVGKSSLLHAGVVHRLRQLADFNRKEYGSPELAVAIFSSWQDEPLEGLRQAAKKAVERALGTEIDEEGRGDESLSEYLGTLSKLVGRGLYIILDQFEESFQYLADQEEPECFASELAEAINTPGLRVNFLISIREDMLAKLDSYEGRIRHLLSNRVRIEPLDREGARAAIEKPLEHYSTLSGKTYTIELALVDAVLDAIGLRDVESAGRGEHPPAGGSQEVRAVAPLLQLVMERLWREEREMGSQTLRLSTLKQRLGGAQRIAEIHIEERLDAMSQRDQDIAADVLDRLVAPSGAKRAHPLSDFAFWLQCPETQIEPVVEALCAQESRILKPVSGRRFEIYHDVLGKPISVWTVRHRQAALERRRRRRQAFLVAAALVALAPLVYVLVRDWRVAVHEADIAAEEARIRRAEQLADVSEDQPNTKSEGIILSGLFAVESLRVSRTEAGEKAMQEALLNLPRSAVLSSYEDAVQLAVFGPRSERLAVLLGNKTVSVLDVDTGTELDRRRFLLNVHGFAFGPAGERLAVALATGETIIWRPGSDDTASFQHTSAVKSVSFSPEGDLLASGCSDGMVRIWDLESGEKLWILQPGVSSDRISSEGSTTLNPPVSHVAFSSGGRMLAVVTDRVVCLWDPATGEEIARWDVGASVLGITFDVTGQTVTATTDDGFVREIETATMEQISEFKPVELANRACFSRDGTRLAVSSRDGAISVWQADTRELLVRIAHDRSLNCITFGKGGMVLATGSDEGLIQQWETYAGRTENAKALPDIERIRLSPCGRRAAGWVNEQPEDTAREPDAVQRPQNWIQLVDTSTGEVVHTLANGEDGCLGIRFDPLGECIAAVGGDGVVRIWALSGEEAPRESLMPLRSPLIALSPGGELLAVRRTNGTVELRSASPEVPVIPLRTVWAFEGVFSGDGRLLATAGYDRKVRIWDTSTGAEVGAFSHSEQVSALAISNDAARLASADSEHVVQIWDVEQGTCVKTPYLGSQVNALSFGPDGNVVGAVCDDGIARVFDAWTGEELLRFHHNALVSGVAFDAENSLWVTLSGNAAWGWRTIAADTTRMACARLPRNFTQQEWREFFPDEEYRCTCENLPPGD